MSESEEPKPEEAGPPESAGPAEAASPAEEAPPAETARPAEAARPAAQAKKAKPAKTAGAAKGTKSAVAGKKGKQAKPGQKGKLPVNRMPLLIAAGIAALVLVGELIFYGMRGGLSINGPSATPETIADGVASATGETAGTGDSEGNAAKTPSPGEKPAEVAVARPSEKASSESPGSATHAPENPATAATPAPTPPPAPALASADMKPLIKSILDDLNEARDQKVYDAASDAFRNGVTKDQFTAAMQKSRAVRGRLGDIVAVQPLNSEDLKTPGLALAVARIKGEKDEAVGYFQFTDQGGAWRLSALELHSPAHSVESGLSPLMAEAAAFLKDAGDKRSAAIYSRTSASLQSSASEADFEAFVAALEKEVGVCESNEGGTDEIKGLTASLAVRLKCTSRDIKGRFQFEREAGLWKLMSVEIPAHEEPEQGPNPPPYTELGALLSSELSRALEARRPDWLFAMVQIGADVDDRDVDGETPLVLEAKDGHLDMVTSLLAAGADVNKKDRSGKTALTAARENERADVVAALLAAGAN